MEAVPYIKTVWCILLLIIIQSFLFKACNPVGLRFTFAISSPTFQHGHHGQLFKACFLRLPLAATSWLNWVKMKHPLMRTAIGCSWNTCQSIFGRQRWHNNCLSSKSVLSPIIIQPLVPPPLPSLDTWSVVVLSLITYQHLTTTLEWVRSWRGKMACRFTLTHIILGPLSWAPC